MMIKTSERSVKINHNPIRSFNPDHPYRISIIGGSVSSKINVLLNLIIHQRPDVDKSYLYTKDPSESKY